MEFEKWLKAEYGLDADKLADEQRAKFRDKFATACAEAEAKADADAKAAGQTQVAVPGQGTVEDRIQRTERQGQIEAAAAKVACGVTNMDTLRRIKEVKDEAVKAMWPIDRAEQELARTARPIGAMIQTHEWTGRVPMAEAIEASLALNGRMEGVEKRFRPEVLAFAEKKWPRRLGLQETLLIAAQANGFTGISLRGNLKELLRAAFGRDVQAGFSTIDIGGILSNVSNKFLLEGFNAVETTWRRVSSQKNVSDFKQTGSYRLTGDDKYERIAPQGEIKHGTLEEEKYFNQADTYGKMLVIDRRDIINDDLGAITTVPRKLGRGAGLALNEVFWVEFLDDAAFFTVPLNNLIVGNALSVVGLTAADTLFMLQVDSQGNPIGTDPAILLVPPQLKASANALVNPAGLRDPSAGALYPTANPHAEAYRVEVSRYLSNANFAGGSATAWYLLASPSDLPVIEVAFLDGKEAPTIETAEADFETLGIKERGYHDFGVAKQDGRGGIKSDGTNGS